MGCVGDEAGGGAAHLVEFVHEAGLGVQAASGVDVEVLDAASFCGRDCVVEYGGWVTSVFGLDHLNAGARGPDFKLFDCCGAKCVGGAQEHGVALRAAPGSQLAAGGGFAGAVDAYEERDLGRGCGRGDFALRGFKNGLELNFEEVAQLIAALDGFAECAVAQGVEDGVGGLHAEGAGEQRGFEVLEGLLVDDAGERGDAVDFGRERLASVRLVVGPPRSLVSSADSRPAKDCGSTTRVSAAMPSILEESDSRVRETACFMRAKRPGLVPSVGSTDSSGDTGGLFLAPKNFIIECPALSLEHQIREPRRGWAAPLGRLWRLSSAACGPFTANRSGRGYRLRYS